MEDGVTDHAITLITPSDPIHPTEGLTPSSILSDGMAAWPVFSWP
jgi:hypothetical protein